MHNIPDLGDFGYIPTNIKTDAGDSFSGIWKGIIALLVIGALLFLVFELFFKEDRPTKGIASNIRKSLEQENI